MSQSARPKSKDGAAAAAAAPGSAGKATPRRSKKDKEKRRRPASQHAVFKTKAKAKKLFNQLDVTKRKRITKQEFVDGLRQIFEAEEMPVSELGLEMMWEQMTKDETNKVGVAEFLSRFVSDSSVQFGLADKANKEEGKAVEAAPTKLAPQEFKRLQEVLYHTLSQWRYVDRKVFAPGKALSKKELRAGLVELLAAERAEAAALRRPVEDWGTHVTLLDADAEKLLAFAPFGAKGTAKFGDIVAALEKVLPPASLARPVAPATSAFAGGAAAGPEGGNGSSGSAAAAAAGGAGGSGGEGPESNLFDPPVPPAASALETVELKTVRPETMRAYVAETLFHVLAAGEPWLLLRAARDKVAPEPLLAYPPLAHWSEADIKQWAVTRLDDPRTERGGLLLFMHSVTVGGVKRLPKDLANPSGPSYIVIYAQFQYGCQTPGDDVIQWRVRAKLFLAENEQPLHLKTEDAAVWINGDEQALPTSEFADWDFPDLPFQTSG